MNVQKEKFEDKHAKDKKYCYFRVHSHYTGEFGGATHSKCNLKYCQPKKNSLLFHDGSNFDYYLIEKDLAEEQFTRTAYLFRKKY